MAQDIDQLDAIISKFMDYARPNETQLRETRLSDIVEREVQGFRDPDQIQRFVARVKEQLGPATILVNNAGGQFPTAAENLGPKGWEAVIRNNLNGTFFMTQAVATAHMIPRKKGRILNIIANVARGFPGMVHTGAARAGVENMTKTLAVEWAQHDIQVNAIAPGTIRSSGTEQYPEELLEMARKNTPAKRLGSPEEVADLAVYLVCDAAAFVTGETWYIDGGAHLWGDTWLIPEPGGDLAPATIPGVR
jgi:citronellol/citronellal dehydrogenase